MSTSTEHEVALFETDDGKEFFVVWIDAEDIETFAEDYSEEEWQTSIEEHPFIVEKGIPVVIAFEDEDGDPRLYGPEDLVEFVSDFDWDNITWGLSLSLEWPTEEDE